MRVVYNEKITKIFEKLLVKATTSSFDFKFQFFYNNIKIENNDNNPAEYYFKNELNPTIFVHDINNIIKGFSDFLWEDDINDSINTIKIKFKDNHGDTVEIISNKKKEINYLIAKYLIKIEHEELNNIERKDEIQFLYNQNKTEYDNTTKIEDFFNNDNNPIIQVNDLDGMLLCDPITFYSITFKINQGYITILYSFVHYEIGKITSSYLIYIEHPELIGKKDNIIFLYKGQRLDEKTTARKFFKNDSEPKILVMDTNNLLVNASKYNYSKTEPRVIVIFNTEKGYRLPMPFNFGTPINI